MSISRKNTQEISQNMFCTKIRKIETFYFALGRGAKYCDEYVCLSVRTGNSKTTRPNFKFLCMLPVAVVQFSSDGVALCYVLPVLWMTSCFYHGATGPKSSMTLCLEEVRQQQIGVAALLSRLKPRHVEKFQENRPTDVEKLGWKK